MLVIKRFTAEWCAPCKQFSPIFNELQNEFQNISFQTINVDLDKNQVSQNNVTSIPTIIIEKNNQQVYRFSGVLPKSVLREIIKKYL